MGSPFHAKTCFFFFSRHWKNSSGLVEIWKDFRWVNGVRTFEILVGGLEHDFFDFPYIGNNNPNWLIFVKWVETTNQNSLTNSIILQLFSFSVSRMTAQYHSTSIRFEGKTQDPWLNGLQNLMLPSKVRVCQKIGVPQWKRSLVIIFPHRTCRILGVNTSFADQKKIRFLVTHHSKYPPSHPGRMGQNIMNICFVP